MSKSLVETAVQEADLELRGQNLRCQLTAFKKQVRLALDFLEVSTDPEFSEPEQMNTAEQIMRDLTDFMLTNGLLPDDEV